MTVVTLAEMGSYTVGGRAVSVKGCEKRVISLSAGLAGMSFDPNGHFWIEQAYVQYFVPERRQLDLPLVLIHGGGLTGSSWETTPDDRPGWLNHFLAAGLAVHVVDNVERGRAGFCALDGEWADTPVTRSEEESWTLYRLGAAADYSTRTPFEGQRFPVHRLDELTRRTVPRWASTVAAQRAALMALIEKLGPCLVLGHSQGGGFALELAAARPELVQAAVVLEPHGDFSSVGRMPLQSKRLLAVFGDFMDCTPLWVDLRARADTALEAWRTAGGAADSLVLSDLGMPGHSHMMMMDGGSERIADCIVQWLLQDERTSHRRGADAKRMR